MELTGDSMLVVRWLEGIWTVKAGFYEKQVGEIPSVFHKWWSQHRLVPRRIFEPWVRHTYREINKAADQLATLAIKHQTSMIFNLTS